MNDIEKTEKLMTQGFQYLEDYQFDAAIKVGKKLKKIRHSSAFEILALAYKEKDNPKKAIKILEEGVDLAPKVWRLWQLLGNYYSDEEQFSKSQKCYETALKCPGTDESSVNYNSAIAFIREGKYPDALQHNEKINYETFGTRAFSQKVEILSCLKMYEEAVNLGRELVGGNWDENEETIYEEKSYAFAVLSEALLKSNKNDEALSFALKAINVNKHQQKAAWLIREIENKKSSLAKYYRLIVEGTWPEPFEGEIGHSGFYTNYDVVADSIEEAFELLKRFEPEEICESLKIEEVEIIENRPDEPKGVYSTSGYAFFPKDDI